MVLGCWKELHQRKRVDTCIVESHGPMQVRPSYATGSTNFTNHSTLVDQVPNCHIDDRWAKKE